MRTNQPKSETCQDRSCSKCSFCSLVNFEEPRPTPAELLARQSQLYNKELLYYQIYLQQAAVGSQKKTA